MPQNKALSAGVASWLLLTDEGGDTELACGGIVVRAKAALTLAVGDAVWISGDGIVSKSLVTADFLKVAGVVLGGRAFGRNAIQRQNDVGVQCALINEEVFICQLGLCFGVAQAAITAGAYVKPDVTTAGRLNVATVTTDLAAGDTGKMIGRAWTAAAGAASKFIVNVSLQ